MSYDIEYTDFTNRPSVMTSIVSSHETLDEAKQALSAIKAQVKQSWSDAKFTTITSDFGGFSYHMSGLQNLLIGIYKIIEN